MKIVVLDGYTLNPGDLSWNELNKIGDVKICDRTSPDKIVELAPETKGLISEKNNRMRCILFYLMLLCLSACADHSALFEKIPDSHSGILFNNSITETDLLNPMSVVNIYNGGGVGIGDFNNDGLQDIYFTGNQTSSKMYLNKGDFEFEDITDRAGVDGAGRWARGVSVIDINNDGLQDLYICNTINKISSKRQNILYVNQGTLKDGIPVFKDMASEYGLNINVQSTMAYFFDYDNDGDLDMYLVVNEASSENQNQFGKKITENEKSSKGRLYQNDYAKSVNHPVFHDVSEQAGITLEGFGHSATITDINLDGWKDIYVSNDFISENILYINNQDGTFTNRSKEYFKHTSFNSMGQDIIDINNDGLSDVVELDMNPEDNYRKKMMLPSNNYNIFLNFEIYGIQFQYIRNTLQLNQGQRILENDSLGAPVFSEIGFMSGMSQTDWSWAPVVMDFDNDGYRDMIITNGFPKDVTDQDFIAYRKKSISGESPVKMLDKIPEVKLANYVFKNRDGLRFDNVTKNWGLSEKSFSNGAAYADFDNDGDMDLVVNNIDDVAFLYKNTLRSEKDTITHFLQVKCSGDKNNINGLGTLIRIYYDNGKQQQYENTPYRGYLSTYQNIAHFGLGKSTMLDSVIIMWPDGKKQALIKVSADQLLKVNIKDAKESWSPVISQLCRTSLFKEITSSSGINYIHKEVDFIDFDIQNTLPRKLSEFGPALAAGDV
ncbi:MAG: VCBS repeat-containing protein, partial [Chitinophagaceae bacterium]|nr:VCBS repeat-containing protein [Chitinophagaceae bacterium]